MKEINLGNVKPVVEPSTTDRPSRKAQTGGQQFSRALESAVSKMNEVAQSTDVKAARKDTTSIREEHSAANERFTKLMQAGDNLRQLHELLSQKPQDKR